MFGKQANPHGQGHGAFPAADSARGFDFGAAMRSFARQLLRQIPDLGHIDLDRCVFAVSQARNRSQFGVFASCTPLRFEDGLLTGRRHGRLYRMQQVVNPDGVDPLYIVTFFLPRFMDLPAAEKVETVIHELWHIGPKFDGDLRRYPGRYYAHGRSGANDFDTEVKTLTREWERTWGDNWVPDFFRQTFNELHQQRGPIFGVKAPRPKLLPVSGAA